MPSYSLSRAVRIANVAAPPEGRLRAARLLMRPRPLLVRHSWGPTPTRHYSTGSRGLREGRDRGSTARRRPGPPLLTRMPCRGYPHYPSKGGVFSVGGMFAGTAVLGKTSRPRRSCGDRARAAPTQAETYPTAGMRVTQASSTSHSMSQMRRWRDISALLGSSYRRSYVSFCSPVISLAWYGIRPHECARLNDVAKSSQHVLPNGVPEEARLAFAHVGQDSGVVV